MPLPHPHQPHQASLAQQAIIDRPLDQWVSMTFSAALAALGSGLAMTIATAFWWAQGLSLWVNAGPWFRAFMLTWLLTSVAAAAVLALPTWWRMRQRLEAGHAGLTVRLGPRARFIAWEDLLEVAPIEAFSARHTRLTTRDGRNVRIPGDLASFDRLNQWLRHFVECQRRDIALASGVADTTSQRAFRIAGMYVVPIVTAVLAAAPLLNGAWTMAGIFAVGGAIVMAKCLRASSRPTTGFRIAPAGQA